MTIHIYGDSFGAEYDDDETWPVVLSNLKKEEAVIYAQAGTGPNWSLKMFIDHLEKDEIKNFDTVVFLLSDHKRLEFPFLENKQHTGGTFRILEEKWQHPFQPGPCVTQRVLDTMGDQSYLNDYVSEIRVIAQTLGPMFLYENVKNITFLHLISKQYKKIRFVVFTCFSLEHYLPHYEDFNIKSTKLLHSLNFESLDGGNFDYVKIPIGHMVGQNVSNSNHVYNQESILKNHMSPDQNKKFGKFVYDIIMYNEPDKSWFSTGEPYDDITEQDRPVEPLFIYE